MYRVAGCFITGTDGIGSEFFFARGSLDIPLSSGAQSALSLNALMTGDGTAEIPYSSLLEGTAVLPAPIDTKGDGSIIVRLAMTDFLLGSVKSFLSMPLNGIIKPVTEISVGVSGSFIVFSLLDDAVRAERLIVRVGLASSCNGSLSVKSVIDADDRIEKSSVEFFLNDKSFKEVISSAEISFYGDGVYAYFSAVVACPLKIGDVAKFIIEGDSYSFLIEKAKISKKKTVISGRSIQVFDDAPYSAGFNLPPSRVYASLLAGGTRWEAYDYVVRFSGGKYLKNRFIKKLADETGAETRICADGVLRVVDPYSAKSKHIIAPLIDARRIYQTAGKSGVCVFSSPCEPVIVTDKKAQAGTFSKVKVYADRDVHVTSDADILQKFGNSKVRITEELLFSDGKASGTYPVFRLVSGADFADGRDLYINKTGISFGKVTYETLKYDYAVFEDECKKTVIRAVSSGSRYCAGRPAVVKEYESKLTDDGRAMFLRASNGVKKLCGGMFIELTHLYDRKAAEGAALLIETQAGSGYCISSSLKITSSPLKIIQKTMLYSRENING